MFPGFTLFGKYISSYMLTSLAGIFTACPLAISRYKKRGGNDISMIFVFLFGAIGCAVGMHLLYGITNIQHWSRLFSAGSFQEFWDAAIFIFGGSVFYGGLIGGLFAGYLCMKHQKLDYGLTSDCTAPSIALFHAFGRIGCFLGGCCYGVEWEHGITFHNALVESANGVPRVPVQLFEAGLEFALFGLLSLMLAKGFPLPDQTARSHAGKGLAEKPPAGCVPADLSRREVRPGIPARRRLQGLSVWSFHLAAYQYRGVHGCGGVPCDEASPRK